MGCVLVTLARPDALRRVVSAVLVLSVAVLGGCGERTKEQKTEAANSGSTAVTASGHESQPTEPRFRFVDRSADCGISFVPRNGEEAGHLAILETLGAGVALFDADADGQLDVFAVGGGQFDQTPSPRGLPCALFRQVEQWAFRDVAEHARCRDVEFYAHGVAVADFDNDGFRDVLLTGYRGIELFQNCGDGTFATATETASLSNDRWSTSATWGDFNNDGALDLYVVNYVDWSFANHPACDFRGRRDVCAPKAFNAEADVLWLSRGDGSFADVSMQSGLQPGGKGLAVLSADLDLDGDTDLYVANDTTPNLFYRNDGNGHFTETGIRSGTALGEGGEADGSMGVEVCDYNRDGRPDLWVSNYENQTFALYRNDGHGMFQHVSSVSGISAVGRLFVGFGTAAADFDLDGDEDLIATNGHVMRTTSLAPQMQRALLFENLGNGRFRDVGKTTGGFFEETRMGRGLAIGDLDGDGDHDFVISHMNQPLAVLENRSERLFEPQTLRIIGTNSARDGIGARVVIPLEGGGQTVRLLKSGGSYLSTSSFDVSGIATNSQQTLRVIWRQRETDDAVWRVGNVDVRIEAADQ